MTWRPVGVREADLAEGVPRGATVDGSALLLVRVAGSVRALDGACPHIGGELADGTVDLGKITCPLHGATFDLESGAVRADPFGVAPPEGAVGPLRTYPTRVVEGNLEVDL